jgi:FKBP12-rapamycin complex-associated protein
MILRETRDTSILDSASRSLGRLAQISGTVLGDHFLEEQIPSFLEIGTSDEISSLGAVFALKELARHSSPSFFPHLPTTFTSILVFLRDSQVYLY